MERIRIESRDEIWTLQHCSILCSAAESLILSAHNSVISHWIGLKFRQINLLVWRIKFRDETWTLPAALQYSIQCCKISIQSVTQPFLVRFSWNLVESDQESKLKVTLENCSIPCSAAESLKSQFFLSHFLSEWTDASIKPLEFLSLANFNLN